MGVDASLSSELVRNVLESAPDAMIIIDADGLVLFANRQVEALFGHAAAEVIGKPVEQLLPERFRDRHVGHRRGYGNVVRPMGVGLELFARRSDGTEFPVEVSLSPIRQEGGTLVAAAIRNVTDRVRVERELREANAAAARATLSKSRFLATASHDLRQPLQTLTLLNGTLRRLVGSGDAQEALNQQELALEAMSRLLNALLDVSKLESGAIRPDITSFCLLHSFSQVRGEFAGLAARKGLQLIVENTDAQVHSDAALLDQALKNLVSNAIKYTAAGSVQLRAVDQGAAVRVEVSDTGCGIDAEFLPFIFDEFYQAGVAPSTSRDGYGLGLSIVQNVARLLDLRVDVQSRTGKGSVFALEIPRGASGATQAATATRDRSRASIAPQAGGGRHLLLVEDDPGVRNATRMFLRGEAYRVTTAASFEEAALHLGPHSDLDLVISDYHLEGGGQTGADVITAARQRFGGDFPAILVTGDTALSSRDLAGDSFLRVTSKPINGQELLGLIQALLPG